MVFKVAGAKYFTIAAVALLVLAAGIYAIAKTNPKEEVEDDPILVRQGDELTVPDKSTLRTRLLIAPVNEVASPHILTVPGVIEADPALIINILPPLAGRVTELKVNLGDEVSQGQLLAIIHSPDLDQANEDVEKAKDALELANKALDRARKVNIAGANAIKDLEQIESSHNQAVAELKRAESRLNTLVDHSPDTLVLSLFAPESGMVTTLNIGVGSYVTDPTAVIMTISNVDNVYVTANLPEELVPVVAKGQSVDVDLFAYPGQTFQGKVSFINALIDPDTHRNKVRIAFANPNSKLKPNMYANVNIQVPQSMQVIVPQSALLMNNDTITVFVEVAPWTFVRRVVELGYEDQNNARILSGLKAGDQVVIRGGVLLND